MHDPRALAALPDVDLEAALRGLGRELAWPPSTPLADLDPARRARLRIEQTRLSPIAGWREGWGRSPGRPLRRAFVLAIVAVVAIAALAAALGLGLPGIRFVTAPTPSATGHGASPVASPTRSPTSIPSPTIPGPPGTGLGLGDPIPVADASGAVDFPVVRPPAETVGAPVSAWLLAGRLSLVWASGPGLPAMDEPGVGLILTEFRGSIDAGYLQKVIDQGTTITPVTVGGAAGFWITGQRHELVLVDPSGQPVFDSRRSVGDTLIWARGDVTYRLETALGRADGIALAESLR
jgi:hypothetical protein